MKFKHQYLTLFGAIALLLALGFVSIERWYLDSEREKTEFCEEDSDEKESEETEETEETDEREREASLHYATAIASYTTLDECLNRQAEQAGVQPLLITPTKFYLLYHQIKVPEDLL